MSHPEAAFYYKLFAFVNFSFLLIQEEITERISVAQDLDFKVSLHQDYQNTKKSKYISYTLISLTCAAITGGLILSNRQIVRFRLHESGKKVKITCLDFFGFATKEIELNTKQIKNTRRFHSKIWFYQLEIEKDIHGKFRRRSLFYRPYNLADPQVWRIISEGQIPPERQEVKLVRKKKKK